ncbi:archease [Deltaproteobacteria bacterium PRO3]|nr:archease [Deltaproteobacteria bacterium PRO3]
MEKSYRQLDHTGDLGVEVWGASWEDLFEKASLALVELLADPDRILQEGRATWRLEAETREALLVRHLEEILYRMDAQGMVFSKFRIAFPEPGVLACEAWGEPLDRRRHHFKTELKAVTYHGLKLWEEGGLCRARVIFDV